NVAVVGATGLVGQEFLKIAAQRRFPIKGLRLLASHRSVGRKMTVGEWAIEVEEATPRSFQGIDLAFFSATTEVSRELIPAAVKELTEQTRQVMEGNSAQSHVYPHQIAFNLLPQVDVFLGSGYTKEEWKIINETRKIMHEPELAVSATCVRVPVYVGHSEAVHAEFSKAISP